jgi:FimV-like protein
MATKLDLARAYIEMGDYVAAMNLLSEVEMSGDTEEKVEAKRLGDHIK